MTNAQEQFVDDLGDDSWKQIEDKAEKFYHKAEDSLAVSDSIGGTGGRYERTVNERREAGYQMRDLDPVKDAEEIKSLQKVVDRCDKDLALMQQSSALARTRAAPFRDIPKRLKLLRREYPDKEPIPNPISSAKKPDREVILDSRKRDGLHAKEAAQLPNKPVPKDHARARLARDLKALRSLPDFTKYTDRKRSEDDWTADGLRPRDVLGILLELHGDELEAAYDERFERFYQARGEGMTDSEIKYRIREINKERLELQRLEHSHMLGFERDGVVLTARKLSLFVQLEFRLEGVSRLYGMAGHFEESW